MTIEHFTILNDDGSVNQSEYERCINFLNSYVSGSIKVYPEVTWADPLEIDMDRDEPALEILKRYLNYDSNKLLNTTAFSSIKKLFLGILDRYGSSIHSYGRYLEQSSNFTDGPGYMYDVFLPTETEIKVYKLNDYINIYYLDDDNHTVLEYNDTTYAATNTDDELPTSNIPVNNIISQNNLLTSNVDGYPNVYKGNLCGVYSDFQRLAGQYVGSSTLFYYSENNDTLYTTGGSSYRDETVHEVINFNYKAVVYSKSKPTRGVDLSLVEASQNAIINAGDANAYIPPSTVNTVVGYLTPTFFTAKDTTDWII